MNSYGRDSGYAFSLSYETRDPNPRRDYYVSVMGKLKPDFGYSDVEDKIYVCYHDGDSFLLELEDTREMIDEWQDEGGEG